MAAAATTAAGPQAPRSIAVLRSFLPQKLSRTGKAATKPVKGEGFRSFFTIIGQARGNVAIFQIRKLAGVCGPEALRHKRQQHQPGIYLRPANLEFSDHLEHEFTFVSCTRGENSAHLQFDFPAAPIRRDNSGRVLLFFPAGIIIRVGKHGARAFSKRFAQASSHYIFYNDRGLRAGWRLLIYFGMIFILVLGGGLIAKRLASGHAKDAPSSDFARAIFQGNWRTRFISCAFVSGVDHEQN